MENKRYLLLVPIPLIASFLLQVLAGGIYSFALKKFLIPEDHAGSASVLLFIIGLLCTAFFTYAYYKNFPNRGILRTEEIFSIRHIILLVLTGISIQVVLAFALDIILPLIPGAQEYYQITTNILFDKNCFSIVYVSILAPIAEEMIFRGLTFRFAGKAVNAWIANIIQAVLFAVYHMNVVQGVYTFLMGIVLGYVVMKMKSIWAAVILHSTINICGLLLDVIIPDASALTMLEKGLIEGVSLILVALLIREIPTIKERGYAI